MTVLVTGGSGFIGRNLVELLTADGYDVKVIDNVISDRLDHGVSYVAGDVTDRNFVLSQFSRDVDTVIHLAGIVGVKNYLRNPSLVIDVNFESTRHIIEGARKHDADVMFSSTSEIYGKNPKTPWDEDDDRVLGSTNKARWVYSTSKSLSEHLLLSSSESYGIRTVIFRLFNIYGKFQKPINVVPKMITTLLGGKKAQIFDGGTQTRCFTYIDDAVKAILSLMKDKGIQRDYFNIGSNHESSIGDLTEEILTVMDMDSSMVENVDTAKEIGNQYEDIGRRVPAVAKIKERIGWVATTGLHDGLSSTVEWYRKNMEWWSGLI